MKEQESTIKALKTAIKMEIDGKEFYLEASKNSKNNYGKKLLTKLAAEEDIHRTVFEKIFNTLSQDKGWPNVVVAADTGIKTILTEAKNEVSKDTAVMKEEIEAVKTAMELENKTFDYYRECAAKATYPAEKEFYTSLAMQEEGHHKALQDYYQFLDNPAAYFVDTEHPSLDGG